MSVQSNESQVTGECFVCIDFAKHYSVQDVKSMLLPLV